MIPYISLFLSAISAGFVIGAWYVLRSYHIRLERMERMILVQDDELFREGAYPNQGLRTWAREWRGRLRQSVATLEYRLDTLEHDVRLEWRAQQETRIQQEAAQFHAPPRDN
jgi:hypothetical protein